MTTATKQSERRKSFSELFALPLSSQIQELEEKQQEEKEARKNAEEEIKSATRDINEATKKIQTILAKERSKTTLGKEFKNMISMPQVKGIGLWEDSKTLLVYLEVHSRRNKDNRRWRVEIPLSRGTVRFTGFSYKNDCSSKEFCLGNITDEVYRRINEYEFDVLVALLIRFLERNF